MLDPVGISHFGGASVAKQQIQTSKAGIAWELFPGTKWFSWIVDNGRHSSQQQTYRRVFLAIHQRIYAIDRSISVCCNTQIHRQIYIHSYTGRTTEIRFSSSKWHHNIGWLNIHGAHVQLITLLIIMLCSFFASDFKI